MQVQKRSEARASGSEAATKGGTSALALDRGIALRNPMQIDEADRLALLGRQAIDGGPDGIFEGVFEGGGSFGFRRQIGDWIRQLQIQRPRIAPLSAGMLAEGVSGNAEKPGAKARRAGESLSAIPCAEKCFLGQIVAVS